MIRVCALLLTVLIAISASGEEAALDVRFTAFDHARIVLADLQQSGAQPTYRYLVIPNSTVQERVKMKQTVDFVLNSLNTRRTPQKTVGLPNDQAPVILRLDLNWYGISAAAWDNLAEQGSGQTPLPEPYLYVPVEKDVAVYSEAGVANGQAYKAGYYSGGKRKTIDPNIALTGPDKGATYNAIYEATRRARAPMIRADWFVTYASTAPAYYKLLGLKAKEAEVEDLLKRDKVRARDSLTAAITNSHLVTLHNRILNREPTINGRDGGYYYFSIDTDVGIDKEDYLLNLATFETPVAKAKEIIGTLPCGMQAYAVVNGKGDLVPFADPAIAQHSDALPTKLQDKRIWSGLRNCAFCHQGIRAIDCRVRALAQGEVGFGQLFTGRISDVKIQERILDAFGEPFDDLVELDNRRYATALKRVNGLTPAQNATQLEEIISNYLQRPITLKLAAQESGYTEEQIVARVKASVGIDYTLIGMARQPEIAAERINWERRGYIQLILMMNAQPTK